MCSLPVLFCAIASSRTPPQCKFNASTSTRYNPVDWAGACGLSNESCLPRGPALPPVSKLKTRLLPLESPQPVGSLFFFPVSWSLPSYLQVELDIFLILPFLLLFFLAFPSLVSFLGLELFACSWLGSIGVEVLLFLPSLLYSNRRYNPIYTTSSFFFFPFSKTRTAQ